MAFCASPPLKFILLLTFYPSVLQRGKDIPVVHFPGTPCPMGSSPSCLRATLSFSESEKLSDSSTVRRAWSHQHLYTGREQHQSQRDLNTST